MDITCLYTVTRPSATFPVAFKFNSNHATDKHVSPLCENFRNDDCREIDEGIKCSQQIVFLIMDQSFQANDSIVNAMYLVRHHQEMVAATRSLLGYAVAKHNQPWTARIQLC
ncbi:hypothetical protein ABKN59_004714 [Abortiporus biennis]